MASHIKIKWNGEVFDMDTDLTQTISSFKTVIDRHFFLFKGRGEDGKKLSARKKSFSSVHFNFFDKSYFSHTEEAKTRDGRTTDGHERPHPPQAVQLGRARRPRSLPQ